MRHRSPKPEPKPVTIYRVRFSFRDSTPMTARPGDIRNNLPKAKRVLAFWIKADEHDGFTHDWWIEKKIPGGEWERIPDNTNPRSTN